MAVMLDGTETYEWWMEDHRGRKWELFGEDEGNRGVTWESITGAENSIDRELSATSHQIGERLGGYSVSSLEPTITVAINTRDHPKAWMSWKDAWSQSRVNTLFCASPFTRHVKRLQVTQREGRQDPDVEPHVAGLIIQPVDMLSLQGVWLGESVTLGAGDTWHNDGDLPPEIYYLPSEVGKVSLTVGVDTWSADHSSEMAGARVDLDPDEMMKTYVDGEAVPELWSLWRNQWNPLRVGEGHELRVGDAAGHVVVTPRYLGPW